MTNNSREWEIDVCVLAFYTEVYSGTELTEIGREKQMKISSTCTRVFVVVKITIFNTIHTHI